MSRFMSLPLALLPSTMTRWMSRLSRRPAGAAPSSQMHSRIEVCPPERWPSSLSWRGRLHRLLQHSRWVPEPVRPVNRLALVRSQFLEQVVDLDGLAAMALSDRIAQARSLRDLWHLRMPLYSVVAIALDQAEAERRLACLNRHFPVRAPRAGLVPLDA